MKLPVLNVAYGVVLLLVSTVAWWTSDSPSVTALIPAGFGVALIACTPGIQSQSELARPIAVVLIALMLIALLMPLRGAVVREDSWAIIRVGVMLSSTFITLLMFLRAFVDGRKNG